MHNYYLPNSNTPNLEKVKELAWVLRYGDKNGIIDDRLYLAHILNLYLHQREKEKK